MKQQSSFSSSCNGSVVLTSLLQNSKAMLTVPFHHCPFLWLRVRGIPSFISQFLRSWIRGIPTFGSRFSFLRSLFIPLFICLFSAVNIAFIIFFFVVAMLLFCLQRSTAACTSDVDVSLDAPFLDQRTSKGF